MSNTADIHKAAQGLIDHTRSLGLEAGSDAALILLYLHWWIRDRSSADLPAGLKPGPAFRFPGAEPEQRNSETRGAGGEIDQ